MCTALCVSSFISTKDYSSCFWWVTPSTTETEQIVPVTQLESSAICATRLASNTSWKDKVKKSFCLLGAGEELLWSGLCSRQMQRLKRGSYLRGRLQLPKMDLRSYQVEGCWRYSTWSLLSLLWQHTELDHWRWWGGLNKWDSTGQRDRKRIHTGWEDENHVTLMCRSRCNNHKP